MPDSFTTARPRTLLISGLCSVGKSSFVCALWGDSDLLPTAVRDCTQTNTLIRAPGPGESDQCIFLKYLSRADAERFAIKSLAFHRLSEMLEQARELPIAGLDELPPGAQLRLVAEEARRLYAARPDLQVLCEPLTDDMQQLDDFLRFIDSPEFQPSARSAARWEDRREHLMGRRLPDGRLTDTGRLMALEHVELVRETIEDTLSFQIVDTPWIPTLHNARREDLIRERARHADVLVVLTLPQKFEPEAWLEKAWIERPELKKKTLIVFNQIDTVDPRTLFSRDGFSGIYGENLERLARLGLDPANLLMSCTRLPFLKQQANPPAERIARLEKVLAQLHELARARPASEFQQKIFTASDPADAGLACIRKRIEQLTV